MPDVNSENEHGVRTGTNLPNHSMSKKGLGRFVTSGPAVFRQRQAVYRHAAWLLCLAELLPEEDDQTGVTFEQILEAVRNA